MTERETILDRLATGELFDLLVIGGGATGCGVALDAASRGLQVALVERGDFGSGTSSRSTKLLHGGVRYLERALLGLDRASFHLVREALRERGILLRIAPHLCHRLPFVIPLYHRSDLLYFGSGLKIYDRLAGSMGIGTSRTLSPAQVLERFPLLRREGLKGGVLYYDGQFDDARMNLALALSALEHGAVAANYVEAVDFIRANGRLAGARVRDRLSERVWEIRARLVVNACGPGVDLVRRLEDPQAAPLLQVSAGSHIVLAGDFTPSATGITIPRTRDGRVLFVLPWHGLTMVGTTDRPAAAIDRPVADRDDVEYLLRHLARYFQLSSVQVLSSWAGLRPLVAEPSARSTASLHREHLIERSPSGLVTITGGKWTTYRLMAQETVEFALREAGLKAGRCRTDGIILHGGEGFNPGAAAAIAEQYGLPPECAEHLHAAYGGRAADVALLCQGAFGERLAAGYPYLKGEVVYAVRQEFAVRPADFLARRCGLMLLDVEAARAAAPAVLGLMAGELQWDRERQLHERQALEEEMTANCRQSTISLEQY